VIYHNVWCFIYIHTSNTCITEQITSVLKLMTNWEVPDSYFSRSTRYSQESSWQCQVSTM